MRRIGISLLGMLCVLCLWGCARQEQPVAAESTAAAEASVPETEPPATEPPETEPAETAASTEPEPEKIAARIESGFRVFVNDRDCTYGLSDDSHLTKRQLWEDETLRFTSTESCYGLYVEWDQVPGEYRIEWDGGGMDCGAEGFLHDYIHLPEGILEARFVFPEGLTPTVCDLQGFTEGRAPEGVQDWEEPCEQADILVFPTHSDDDTLFFGALISYYAIERELTVQTAFFVEHRFYPERGHERLDGLWEMGVRNYPVLNDAPDTDAVRIDDTAYFYREHDILGWQVEQLRRFRPLVVVGHDLNGEYGNGGHKLNARSLTQAVELSADASQYPASAERYGVWDAQKLYLHLYSENRLVLEVNTPMENDPLGRTPFEAAQDAYDHHESQKHLSYQVRQGDEWTMYDCRAFGLYRTTVGYDTGADIMENTGRN